MADVRFEPEVVRLKGGPLGWMFRRVTYVDADAISLRGYEHPDYAILVTWDGRVDVGFERARRHGEITMHPDDLAALAQWYRRHIDQKKAPCPSPPT